MPGEWTHNGSAQGLRDLKVRLAETGQKGLMRNVRRDMTVATKPARKAVQDKLEEIMPKGGGANEYLARTPVRSVVLTGPKTAGVAVRARKRGSDLKRLNAGDLWHPLPGNNRSKWYATPVPAGWWEDVLRPFGPAIGGALDVTMRATAHEAGFR